MSEITIAKMHADLESLRIAELYSSHPLLVNMPIPHFRLPNVDIDVPVLVKEMDEQDADKNVRGSPSMKEMNDRLDVILDRLAEKEGIDIKTDLRKKIRKAMDLRLEQLKLPNEVSINTNQIANELADSATQILTGVGGPLKEADRRRLRRNLKDFSKQEFSKLFKPAPRLKVLVTSAELRASGASDFITRIHLKINEEGIEWKTVESEDATTDKLVPE